MFVLQFPPSCGSSCRASASLSGPSEIFRGQVDPLCFHCPSYQFLFCPSYGGSRYRPTMARECGSRRNSPSAAPPPSPLSSFLISPSPTDPRSHHPPPHLPLFSVTTWSCSRARWPSSSSAKTQRRDLDRNLALKATRRRRGEHGVGDSPETETVCGWPVWDFRLKIEPMSFSPFLPGSLFGERSPAAGVEAKEKCL